MQIITKQPYQSCQFTVISIYNIKVVYITAIILQAQLTFSKLVKLIKINITKQLRCQITNRKP